MIESALASSLAEVLRDRALDDGGFPMYAGGAYRPDATAWAVFSLAATEFRTRYPEIIDIGRSRLAGSQSADGRVGISPSDPDSYWPTPLAIFAWHGSGKHAMQSEHAIDFLLNTSGRHWEKDARSPLAHDPSIRGWAWTDNTHSWVEPTSLSILALRISGYGEHARVREGARLLLDRQLPGGGWNYGNTLVYGTGLFPQPDCTGLALSALADYVPRREVEKSIRYLLSRMRQTMTPLSLGWGILGLGAWRHRPKDASGRLGQCIRRQKKYGVYDTTLVSLILLALAKKEGLRVLFA